MIHNLKKSSSTIIPIILILTIISVGILTPILTMVIFGAILGYYVRFIAQKIKPYIKNQTLSVFIGIILLSIPIVLLLYFTVSQLLIIISTSFVLYNKQPQVILQCLWLQ